MLVSVLASWLFSNGKERSIFSVSKSRLIITDFVLSFMWIWVGSLLKIFISWIPVFKFYRLEELVKGILGIGSQFLFAWLARKSNGGTNNPLSALARPFSGNIRDLLFVFFVRIPSQMLGSIMGVSTITNTFPRLRLGPRLNVHVHQGALTEGILTIIIVAVYFWLYTTDISNFFMKTWIKVITKLSLRVLCYDLTGGVMNPASAMGWTFCQGSDTTKEYIIVYWLAPIGSAILAVFILDVLFQFHKEKEEKKVLHQAERRSMRLITNVKGNILVREFHRGKLIRRFPAPGDITEGNNILGRLS